MKKELEELAEITEEARAASYVADKIVAQEIINEKTLALMLKIDERLERIETNRK